MEVFGAISESLLSLEPSPLFMVVFTTLSLLVVGTSGRLIITQFAVVEKVAVAVLHFVFTLVVWIVVLIILVVPLTPIWLSVIVLRKLEASVYSRWGAYEGLDTDALTWMMDSAENNSTINCVVMLEREFQVETLRKATLKKWYRATDDTGGIKYPYLRSYVYGGLFYYYWRRERNFDIKRHVYEWSTQVYSKNNLPDVIKEVMKSPFMDEGGKSPWEQILVHFLDGDVIKTCVIIRASHIICDGAAVINLFLNIAGNEPMAALKLPKVAKYIKLLMKIKGLYYMPMMLGKDIISPFPSHHLHNVKLRGIKNIMLSEPISLELIKAIKNKLQVTVNDVLMGGLATKLHQYFKDAGKIPPDEFNAGVPFDTRFSVEEAEGLRNKFAVIMVRLPTRESDVVRNIYDVRTQMNALKMSAQNHGQRDLMRVLNYSLPVCVLKQLYRIFVSRLSMVLSNVPGPQFPFKFVNTVVESAGFVPPGRNRIGISVSFLSYNEKVFVTFSCDDALDVKARQLAEGLPRLFSTVAQSLGINKINTAQ